MDNQNYNFTIPSDDLHNIGINNIPEFFHTSKQVLIYAIANLALIDNEHLLGDDNIHSQITHLQQLQRFIKLLEQKEGQL